MTLFEQIITAAFPVACRVDSLEAAKTLTLFVDHNYRSSTDPVIVGGEVVRIPQRIHFTDTRRPIVDSRGLPYPVSTQRIIQCLRTRSTDGFERQEALQAILGAGDPKVIPFVMLLAGEYVIEIIRHVVAELPSLDRNSYINFVRENRPLMQLLRQKATSYWDCYYRTEYPEKELYPGLVFFQQLEDWAQ